MGPRVEAWLAVHAPHVFLPGFYGVLGLALVLAAWVFRRRSEALADPLEARRALAEAFPLALAGSALLPALFALPHALAEPRRLFENGMVSYAGYLSGLAALSWRARRRHVPLAPLLDALAPALGVGVLVGRWSCFLAGCDYGAPTLLPWGVRYPSGSGAFWAQVQAGLIATYQPLTLPVHPSVLYEAALGGAVALVTARLELGRPGARFCLAAATYAVGRGFIELTRGDASRGHLGALSTAQVISLGVLAACALWWTRRPLREGALA